MSDPLLTTAEVAREMGVTTTSVRNWVLEARLPVAQRTSAGWLLFRRADVDKLKAEADQHG